MPESLHIEATSKPLKAIQLLGVLIIVGSLAAAALYRHDVGLRRGAIGGAVGAGIWALGRFLAWWRHG